jgi:hypothetical protein
MNSKLLPAALFVSALVIVLNVLGVLSAVDPLPCDSKCRDRQVFYEAANGEDGVAYEGYFYFKLKDCLGCNSRLAKNYCKPADGDQNVNNACLRPAGSEMQFLNRYWIVQSTAVCDFPQLPPYSVEAMPLDSEPNGDGIQIIYSKCSAQQSQTEE